MRVKMSLTCAINNILNIIMVRTHILKSGVITLKTPILQDGENYRLALVNPPKISMLQKNLKI